MGDSERGAVLKGLDLGVEGMRIGGQVRALTAFNKSLLNPENGT